MGETGKAHPAGQQHGRGDLAPAPEWAGRGRGSRPPRGALPRRHGEAATARVSTIWVAIGHWGGGHAEGQTHHPGIRARAHTLRGADQKDPEGPEGVAGCRRLRVRLKLRPTCGRRGHIPDEGKAGQQRDGP